MTVVQSIILVSSIVTGSQHSNLARQTVMSEFQVHHVKFCNYVPSGIQSLAYNQTDKVLAVGREDNSVEIWKTGEGRKWLQQKVCVKPRW